MLSLVVIFGCNVLAEEKPQAVEIAPLIDPDDEVIYIPGAMFMLLLTPGPRPLPKPRRKVEVIWI
jgi:hypothetical protein